MKYILLSIFLVFFFVSKSQHSNVAIFNADSNSYIDLGKATDLNNYDTLSKSDKMTITLFVEWGDKNKSGVGGWANLITAADSSGNGDNGVWWIQHNSNNTKFEFALNTGSRSFIQSTTNPIAGVWYHIACVYDGNTMRLYINGVEEAHANKNGDIANFNSNTKLNFGRWPNASNNYRKFDGKIDELSIWNTALTPTQISNLKNNPESVTGADYDADGILGYWNFDDGTVTDLTKNGNSGDIGTGTTLPIELIDFNAEYNKGNIELYWTTATELNNDYFIIERTTNPSFDDANWYQISSITGAGTSNNISEYKFIDNNINTNMETYYYRLKQVDFDGKFTYSDIISVSLSNSYEIQVFPNPSTGVFKISGLTDNTYNYIEIYNSTGQLIKKIEGLQEMTVDITNQPSGIYFIKSGETSIRVIKK